MNEKEKGVRIEELESALQWLKTDMIYKAPEQLPGRKIFWIDFIRQILERGLNETG